MCGIVSAYNYAKQNNLRFKIYFVCPFRLQDILLPASFNWIVDEDELSHNIDEAVPVYISHQLKYTDVAKYYHDKLYKLHDKQIHLYTNAKFFKDGEFSVLFAELFKPVPMLHHPVVGLVHLLCIPEWLLWQKSARSENGRVVASLFQKPSAVYFYVGFAC